MSILLPSRNVRGDGSRKLRENGAALVEFAGMAIVVAILLGGVIAVAPSHGRDISCRILSKISEAIGAGGLQCGATDDSAQGDKHKPTEPCTTSQRTRAVNASIGVAIVNVEVRGGFVVETLSDGRYRITRTGAVEGGVSIGVGVGFEVKADNQGYGQYLGAEASLSGSMEGGDVYEVDSEKAKDDLITYLIRDTAGGVAGDWGVLVNYAINLLTDYQPPKPTESYIQIGAEGSASAEVMQGFDGAQAEASIALAVGVKANHDTGTTTYYYKLNGDASVNARKAGMGLDAGASGEAVVAVTVNTKDLDKLLNVSVTGMYDAQIGATTPLGIGNPQSLESGQVWTASVDLNSVETNRMARDFLAAARIPGFGNGRGTVENLDDATSTFVSAVADRGVLTRQDVSQSTSEYGGKMGVELALELSAGLGYSDENIEFSNGEYYSGGKWNRWEGC